MTTLSPAELARASLRRIAELRIPPTPANFAQHYLEAGGSPPAPAQPLQPGGAPATAPQLQEQSFVQRAGELVAQASDVAGSLAEALGRQSDDLGASLEGLVALPSDTAGMLAAFIASTRDIQATVHASHAELQETRRSFEAIKAELAESRRLLGQDPLTGSDNRRAMDEILDREIARARRDGEPLALAMIDIDHFKAINDRFGHAAGDAALVHLTRVAKAMLRGNDAFVRYGGEEFILVLPETGLQGGVFAAERLQALLNKRPCPFGSTSISMTFSAGVSLLQDGDSPKELLARADAALYRAKREGRNRVVAADGLVSGAAA